MPKSKLLYISLGSILFFSFFLYFLTEETYTYIAIWSVYIRNVFGRFYLWLGLGCVFILAMAALSPWGNRRFGTPEDRPEFSRLAWISMLYSAGMGAGILLRAVQEPVFMLLHPPIETGVGSEIIALEYTFYQWGLTAWAFYAIFAIVIGHYLYTKSKKVLCSTAFGGLQRSVLSTKQKNTVFLAIDVLCILTTVFGLVAAIGLGTTQIKGGLQHILKFPMGINVVISIVILISFLALLSAYRGVRRGIRLLSTYNIYLTLLLLLYVFVQGDIRAIIVRFSLALYHYIIDFIPLSLALGTYDPGEIFLTDWTYYYWAFWLAWAPFTGIFIARISRGRTLRELIVGVLLIPSLGTFIWFTVFGNSVFDLINAMVVYQGDFDNVFTSIFHFFENYPLSGVINIVIILLLISFLITSVDSAIFVLSMFTDDGKTTPDKKHRLLWAGILMIFTIGIVLLGNAKEDIDVLTSMQKLLIITSLPFSILMILMILLFIRDYSTPDSIKN